jgi:hypothetical protein
MVAFTAGTMLAVLENEIGGRMDYELQMEQMPGYLAVRFIGAGAPGEVTAQFDSIVEYCRRAKSDRLLIDTTGYDVKVSVTDRFRLGERLRVFAGQGIKVVFVSRPEQLDPRKFGALVAQNRGVTADVFTDLQSAEAWLLK